MENLTEIIGVLVGVIYALTETIKFIVKGKKQTVNKEENLKHLIIIIERIRTIESILAAQAVREDHMSRTLIQIKTIQRELHDESKHTADKVSSLPELFFKYRGLK